ncbi:MAG: hypothetical protein ACJ74U_00840 [Jatrophihabitantaceae bacterium]
MPHIPTPIRAALGLAATAVAEARKLPETLPHLPVTALSTAMQASLRVQQHIATFASRGDEVISHLRGTSAEPPAWATFDDAPAGDGRPTTAFDRADAEQDVEPVNLEDTAARPAEPGQAEPAHSVDPGPTGADTASATPGEPAIAIEQQNGAAPAKAAKAAPAKAAPAKAAPAKAAPAKAPAKKAAAKQVPPVKKAPATKAAKKSEPLVEAAKKADPAAGPNPSTMAAEILNAHQGESPAEQ